MTTSNSIIRQRRLIAGLSIGTLFLGSIFLLLKSPVFLLQHDAIVSVQTGHKTDIHDTQSITQSNLHTPIKLDKASILDATNELHPFQNSSHAVMSAHQKPVPKITLIAIWNPQDHPVEYLPHFFASVGANSAHLDLVFIKYDKRGLGKSACETPLAQGVPNVREVCLTEDEYWTMHADFLCEKWTCSDEEKGQVLDTLRMRAPIDYVNSYFRPFRAAIFKKYMDPRTPIWGWCDMDIMLGDFGRIFPWDIAYNFDVLVAAPSSDDVDAIMLYTTGHLALFKNAPHVTDAYLKIPQLHSATAFLELPWFERHDAEECEYSHWLLIGVPELTFLRFPAMADSQYYIATLNSGVYSMLDGEVGRTVPITLLEPSGNSARAALNAAVRGRDGTKRWRWRQGRGARTTFTDAGHEYEVNLRAGQWEGHLWCPIENAVDFVIDHSKTYIPADGIFSRYVMRRVPHGPVYDRIEPVPLQQRIVTPSQVAPVQENGVLALEMLYKHFHGEKYRDWWTMPAQPLRPGEMLFGHKDLGAWAWTKEGRMTFDTRPAALWNEWQPVE